MATVLLIEDEELVRYTLRRILEEGGHEVFEASDGEEGLSEFKMMVKANKPIDVVVTDILMPKKHGYEFITEIQEISPDLKIIAISGGGNKDSTVFLNISKALGANQALPKPISADKLLEAVELCVA